MRRGNWRRRRNRRHHHHDSSDWNQRDPPSDPPESSDSSSGSGSASSSVSAAPAPELPGFYFDPEKNRYFRLLPGHNNCNPLTRESLEKKEREKRRKMMLLEDERVRKKSPGTGLNSTLLLQRRHLGEVHPNSYCSLVHKVKVSEMKRHKLELQSMDASSSGADSFRLMVADSACERVFTVNRVSHGGWKYGIMTVSGCRNGSLSAQMCDKIHFTNHQLHSMCWASVTHSDSHVILCRMDLPEGPGLVSLLPTYLFKNFRHDQPGRLFSFRRSTAWSCAWCHNPQVNKIFSTGLSQAVVLTDAVTGKRQMWNFCPAGDILTQQFAVRTPVLYNGCRAGEVFTIDARQPHPAQRFKTIHYYHDSPITSVRLLEDENYFLAADMLGKIKLWDVRASHTVMQYEGHHNEYAYLPLHLCEREGLLLAVGQDCYTRIWSLRDGHLLRTIPSPHPAEKDSIPNVVFSSHLGGRRGLPGLLMAVCNDLYYYPYGDFQDLSHTHAS